MNGLYLFIYLLATLCFCIGSFLSFSRRAIHAAVGFVALGLVFAVLVRVIQLFP